MIRLIILFLIFPAIVRAQSLSSDDKLKIQYEAGQFIQEFELLMNTIASPGLSKLERDKLKENSYTESANQIFLDNKVIVEDDIDPSYYQSSNKVKDLNIERYLNDLDLFYSKSDNPTISFTNIKTSEVKQGSYIYLEVYFEGKFTGKHQTIFENYKPTKRVATIIAKKEGRSWKMLIGSIVFYNSYLHPFVENKGNKKPEVTNPVVISNKASTTTGKVPSKVSVIKERTVTLGASLGFGAGFNQAGIGAHSQVYLADYLAANLQYIYFIPKSIDPVTEKRWSIDTDLNYVFEMEGATKIPYVLIGLNFLKKSRKEGTREKETDLFTGVNLGAGLEFEAEKNMVYFGEIKYTTGTENHFLIKAGIRFKFTVR
ncbi:hypothetical protein [Chondrinema litorale]|uniref:hypothetical protein n=1 Tax=Chondrinema litorale TaxID=2994555 RepID=UPI0025427E44|nr:hypothetical protein [Chondrinema litorale]UZR92498.1 hypothetical protein OQ292_11565 [Chondrinema litorale]